MKVNSVSFTGIHKDIVGLQWQHGFEPLFQFTISVSQQNFQNENY